MSDQRVARLPGSRPNGSSRNGMPDFAGYRFQKTEGWDPYRGVHRDPSVVTPPGTEMDTAAMVRARQMKDGYEARLAQFAVLQAQGLLIGAAGNRLGVSRKTAEAYARELRRRAQ